ncbi:MAG TPA: DUF1003 domain-containing protein [Mucilaginibacter sp.]|jgi:uncharacterized membrane protein|nr:DUF1003 domain-containing protein [Mucilaginibacter sp.]
MTNINKPGKTNGSGQKTTKDDKIPGVEIKSVLEFNETWIDKAATFITGTFGSMRFLGLCIVGFSIWVAWNLNLLPLFKPFDPYPFQMLTMIVALFAVILSISVLISQNREGKRDMIRQQVEFEVNIRAEMEITKVLTMLHEIQKKLDIHSTTDVELEEMKAETDIKKIHQKLDDTVTKTE